MFPTNTKTVNESCPRINALYECTPPLGRSHFGCGRFGVILNPQIVQNNNQNSFLALRIC